MAALYEIDQAILDCIDSETGEIIDACKLNELQLERNQKIENVALWIKNLQSDAAAYKAEKDVFAEREKTAKTKAESLKKWLTEALSGQKMSTSKVAIAFRKSEAIEIEDQDEFMNFAQTNLRADLLIHKDPVPDKTAIKAAIKAGETIEGCDLVTKQNIQIK